MSFNYKEIVTAFMVLFAVIDIIGNIPIVIDLRKKVGHIQSEKASIIAGIIMIIFLFLGGFMLAQGIQNSNLHKRIALHIVNIIGSKPANLVLGFMIATAGLSMWISNTASVMVMLPIGLSIIEEIKNVKNSEKFLSKFAVALMLGIAYSADIGGMATLIGTPPNLVFMELYHELFPNLPKVGFSQWMMMGLPIAVIFLFTGWLLMTKVIFMKDVSQGKKEC